MRTLTLGRGRRGSRCLLCWSGLHVAQHRSAAVRAASSQDRERNRRQHEGDGRVSGRAAKHRTGGTSAKCSLAAGASKSGRDVGALTVLEQHDDDQESANQNVNDGDQNNKHGCLNSLRTPAQNQWGPLSKSRALVTLPGRGERWCGRGDLNPHAFRRHPLKMVCLPISPLPHKRPDGHKTVSQAERRGLLSIANRRRQKPCGRVQHVQSDVPRTPGTSG